MGADATRETVDSGSFLSLLKGAEAEEDGSLVTYGTRKSKGSSETALSAGNMLSSYIHIISSNDGPDAKSEARDSLNPSENRVGWQRPRRKVNLKLGTQTVKHPGGDHRID